MILARTVRQPGEARRTKSRTASSESLLDGGRGEAGQRLVALIGSLNTTSPRWTTRACPFTADPVVAAKANSRRNSG
ncbi:MAG: hypothetical protein AVDCRST_MAG08-4476 [uncultured Acetobacteraceae bacterium]|uniref:Uncharacterized protein n=1 Tax=uncultured Acetobacteraceae bacterium TaxID=169975 RepID=A0A6J4JWN6_9PROT|nr:MAG: hypothetical protein AVDCRST_MAG08-4476 [uncultured Acetobacteraceae bacterium]